MRILITGARAPACLEWARLLWKAGYTVAVADSAAFPLTRFSRCVAHYFRLPWPVNGVNEYGAALLHAAQNFEADCILPTCEEAFYVAHQRRRLERQCPVFVGEFNLMARLHDKGAFAEFSRTLPVSAPPTLRLDSVEALLQQAGRSRDLVFKPVYSRFAARMLIRPEAAALWTIRPGADEPWIAQEFAAGRELCSYSLLWEGRLRAHCCYSPKYRVGQGSGVYIDPVESDAIRNYLYAFGKATGYTGQVAFDFIESPKGDLSVLECNPRATSGIHLFGSQAVELAARLQPSRESAAQDDVLDAMGSACMVGVAMALFAAPRLRRRSAAVEFRRDWHRAQDIVFRREDIVPVFSQILGLSEIFVQALRHRCSPLAAATRDIEWNGQFLGAQP